MVRYYSSAYPVFASTGNIAYEIYLAGCKGYCEGCHSPHTHDANLGIPMNMAIDRLYDSIDKWYDKNMIDAIVILGGEPLDYSDDEVYALVARLRAMYPKCYFWLYTHFEIDEVRKSHPKTLEVLHYIKCGKFDKSKFSESGFKDEATGVVLSTSNQYIINLTKERNKLCIR